MKFFKTPERVSLGTLVKIRNKRGVFEVTALYSNRHHTREKNVGARPLDSEARINSSASYYVYVNESEVEVLGLDYDDFMREQKREEEKRQARKRILSLNRQIEQLSSQMTAAESEVQRLLDVRSEIESKL